MKSVELLSPAKNLLTGIAAINCGADAVYIGANSFGARVNASNNLDDIAKLVNYAHKFYAKVHVTINTILNNTELEEAIILIKNLYKIGVDAIIVQDMGILQAAIEGKLPPIQIHMSTQCDNRTLEKVSFFDKVGCSRVILARELSIDKISEICKSVNCEIETFIHGALCVSYSGQCYMSYANGGRSANRGECAQPCRKRYSLVDSNNKVLLSDKFLLSLKDFNGSENIEKLINSGVKSFKIEGRLKDESYVKNVTLFYNELLNKYAKRTSSGKVFFDFVPNIDKTFNRGYSDYFLNGRTYCYNFDSPKSMGEKLGKVTKVGKNYFELSAAVNPQDGLCYLDKNGEISGFLVNKVEGNKIYPNKNVAIESGTILYRNYDSVFYSLLEKSKFIRKIAVNFEVYENKIFASDEDNNRVYIEISKNEYANNVENMRNIYITQLSKLGETDFYLNNFDIKSKKLVFLRISEINNLRRVLLQNLMNERLKNYNKLVQKPIGYSDFPISKVDYKANVYNDSSKLFYEKCNCKVCEAALETNNNINSGVELMRTKHCLRFAADMCLKYNKDNKNLYLKDDKGKNYPLKFDCKNCEMVILSP